MKGLKEESILWLCGVKQRFYLTSTKRPVLWIKSKVSSSILLLTSFERFLSPYSKSCTRRLLQRLSISTNGRNATETPARRSRRWISKEGQSNKKCSVSSIPSFVGHIGFTVSLKLWLN